MHASIRLTIPKIRKNPYYLLMINKTGRSRVPCAVRLDSMNLERHAMSYSTVLTSLSIITKIIETIN